MMRRALISSLAALALLAGTAAGEAQSRRDKVAIGVGIAAAAIGLATVAAANRPPRHEFGGATYCQDARTGLYYRDCGPPRRAYQRPRVIYQNPPSAYRRAPVVRLVPANPPGRYGNCAQRYRSFDPRTGLFTTPSGRRMLCR